MEKYFECFNCKDLMGTVYESKCCGILYCQNCKDKLTNTHCIKCNKLLELQRNKFAQRLLKNTNITCKYNCGIKLPYDKMKQHLITCEKKVYICSYDKINNNEPNKQSFKGNKKEILDHLVKEHPQILLLFMENQENFEPILKKLLKKNINNNDINKNDTNLDLTNSINNYFLRSSESEENASIEFEQDIRLLNGINDLNLINSNIENFNDIQLNNHNHSHNRNNWNNNNNSNLNNRINSLDSNSDNNLDNDNLNNNINLLDVDLSRNHYQPLRELRLTSLFNDNENDNLSLEYRFNINNNNNSQNNGNNLNGHNNNTRNRRVRRVNMINNNQNNINNINNNLNINNNIMNNNNGANNINNRHLHYFE